MQIFRGSAEFPYVIVFNGFTYHWPYIHPCLYKWIFMRHRFSWENYPRLDWKWVRAVSRTFRYSEPNPEFRFTSPAGIYSLSAITVYCNFVGALFDIANDCRTRQFPFQDIQCDFSVLWPDDECVDLVDCPIDQGRVLRVRFSKPAQRGQRFAITLPRENPNDSLPG
jgi:hypothetical protein